MDQNPPPIVFLDIDGVLNSDRYVRTRLQPSDELWTLDDLDPDAIEILNRLVNQTEARFVLSSSWRHHHTLDEVAALLRARGFAGNLVDVTPRLFGEPRGAEIQLWLHVQAVRPHAFAVLDDEPATAELEPFWIRTDPAVGVTVSDVQRVVALLASAPTINNAGAEYSEQPIMNEAQFVDEIDAHFPYLNLEEGLRLASEACRISANAAFAVLGELARPPRGVPADTSNRLAVLEHIASRLQHPLAPIVLDLTRKLIRDERASVGEALAVMRAISVHPGQYAALSIAYFSCDDVDDEADIEYQRIRTFWEST